MGEGEPKFERVPGNIFSLSKEEEADLVKNGKAVLTLRHYSMAENFNMPNTIHVDGESDIYEVRIDKITGGIPPGISPQQAYRRQYDANYHVSLLRKIER